MSETNFSPGQYSIVSIDEAASILRISTQQVRRLASSGKIEGFRVGRTWALERESVLEEARLKGVVTIEAPKINPRPDGLVNVSMFSGAMGLDIGLERAGIQTIVACEKEKWSRATIMHNKPDVPLLKDVSELQPDEVIELAGVSSGEDIDVMSGGPPCQAFSTAGARRGFQDPRGNVFLQYLDLVCAIRPRYLVIENVRGLLSAPLQHRPHNQRGDGNPPLSPEELPGGAMREILRTLKNAGYGVSFNLYNAANFGTPQIRERVVILASRDGSRIPHLTPTNSKEREHGLPEWVTFEQAVEGLPSTLNHLEFPEARLKYYRLLGPGQYWRHLPDDLQREALGKSYFSGGGKTGFFRRLAWNKPSPTLVTHPAMPATDLAHPEEDRPLAVEEYKRIQQFPEEWEIQGNLKAQYKQIGNAVPVGLGEAIGRAIVAFDAGIEPEEWADFPYSRYRNNCDRTWSGLTIQAEAEHEQMSLA